MSKPKGNRRLLHKGARYGEYAQDNSNLDIKKAIRAPVKDLPSKSILDLFCGEEGRIFYAVWNQAKKYLGFDLHPHSLAPTVKGDNEKLIKMVNLDNFQVFDIDAYSNPYILLDYILGHHSGLEIEVILTDGMSMCYNNSNFIKQIVGFVHRLLRNWRKDVIKIIINKLLKKHGWTLKESLYIALNKNALSKMYYIYLRLAKPRG